VSWGRFVQMIIVRLASIFAFMLAAAPALAQQTFGETCTGSETVQVGSQSPKTLPYMLTFSVDLKARSYCYDVCGKDQSFPISDPESNPIKLANIDLTGTVRHLTFDPGTGKVVDYQVINAGFALVTRRASGTCKASTFNHPWPQNQSSR